MLYQALSSAESRYLERGWLPPPEHPVCLSVVPHFPPDMGAPPDGGSHCRRRQTGKYGDLLTHIPTKSNNTTRKRMKPWQQYPRLFCVGSVSMGMTQSQGDGPTCKYLYASWPWLIILV